jgi:hypothetical protein
MYWWVARTATDLLISEMSADPMDSFDSIHALLGLIPGDRLNLEERPGLVGQVGAIGAGVIASNPTPLQSQTLAVAVPSGGLMRGAGVSVDQLMGRITKREATMLIEECEDICNVTNGRVSMKLIGANYHGKATWGFYLSDATEDLHGEGATILEAVNAIHEQARKLITRNGGAPF